MRERWRLLMPSLSAASSIRFDFERTAQADSASRSSGFSPSRERRANSHESSAATNPSKREWTRSRSPLTARSPMIEHRSISPSTTSPLDPGAKRVRPAGVSSAITKCESASERQVRAQVWMPRSESIGVAEPSEARFGRPRLTVRTPPGRGAVLRGSPRFAPTMSRT